MDNMELYRQVCGAFFSDGNITDIAPYGEGHINTTMLVCVDGVKYILQHMNTLVFPSPDDVMNNIYGVTTHLSAKGKETLDVIPTIAGDIYLKHDTGCYRIYKFIENTVSHQSCPDKETLYYAGKAFGEFQNALSDFDPAKLKEIIPDFHNTCKRYEHFKRAINEDCCGRVKECKEEIEWLLSVEDEACKLTSLYNEGKLPLRVTHNDTKINNVLFDEKTLEPLVVIDLDTVMPGLVGHDFGDAVRFAANFAEEDCADISKVGLDLNTYWAFSEGFLSKTAKTLTDMEVETLGVSCFAIACELSTRFLADYLAGDRYFKVKKDKHNLVRTRAQIALAKDMQRKMDVMTAICVECCKKYK